MGGQQHIDRNIMLGRPFQHLNKFALDAGLGYKVAFVGINRSVVKPGIKQQILSSAGSGDGDIVEPYRPGIFR
ncbi:hypothetical protein D3C72_2458650 [compost metagenome]